jgi:hypothetical protein
MLLNKKFNKMIKEHMKEKEANHQLIEETDETLSTSETGSVSEHEMFEGDETPKNLSKSNKTTITVEHQNKLSLKVENQNKLSLK